MADADFEARLLRMFDTPPPMADAELFSRQVEARLNRGWSLRQLMIGVAGVAGGLIAAVQMVGSGLAPEITAATEQGNRMLVRELDGLWRSGLGLSGLPLSGEVLWMAAALGVMALALAVTRAVEEF